MKKKFYQGKGQNNFIVISISAKNINEKCPYLKYSKFNLYHCTNGRIIEQSNKLDEDQRVLYGCCGIYREKNIFKNIE